MNHHLNLLADDWNIETNHRYYKNRIITAIMLKGTNDYIY